MVAERARRRLIVETLEPRMLLSVLAGAAASGRVDGAALLVAGGPKASIQSAYATRANNLMKAAVAIDDQAADAIHGGAGADRFVSFDHGPEVSRATKGRVYYVSPNGRNTNPGSWSKPWKSIQYAAQRAVAGDTVYVMAGAYRGRVMPKNSGSPGKYITFASYRGQKVTIDGAGIRLPDDLAGLVDISQRSYIRVSGFRVINASGHQDNSGIMVRNSSHVIVEKNHTKNTQSSGIGVWGSNNVVIDGNDITNACWGGYQENISVAGTDTFEVKGNKVHDSKHKEGICLKDGSTHGKVYRNSVYKVPRVGIYVDAWDKPTSDIAVYQNTVHDVGTSGIATASEMHGLLQNIRIYNNVVYANTFFGILISRNGDEGGSHPAKDIVVANNTVVRNGVEWGGGIADDNPEAEAVVFRNNIVSDNLSFQLSVSADVPQGYSTVDHNLIDGFRNDQDDGEIKGTDFVEGAPKFVNAGKHNYRLTKGSPAIDRGSPAGAPKADFDGNSRPRGKGVDIGAFEQ